MKTCLTLLILFMMFIMLFMIKSMNVSDRLGEIVSVREKSREDKLRLYINILKKQIKPESESINSKSLTLVDSNNISRDNISKVVETKNISSDKIFKVLLNERHHHSNSNQAQNMILDNQSYLRRRKRKNKRQFLYKRRNKTAIGINESQPWNYTTMFKGIKSTSFCLFSFDKNSLQEAITTLAGLQKQSVYLFYINLSTENALQSFTREQRDNLLHWQYVLKKEKFLLNLPVDFDVITFNLLLTGDNEEKLLGIKMYYNDTSCTENFDFAIKSLRISLWNELFANDTSYFLCNKFFEGVTGRSILYAITTIWIGYDLNCTAVDIKDSFEEFKAEKDDLPFTRPICCYFLSLQFVWIFVILDISYQNHYNERQNEKSVHIDKNYCIHFYTRNDRPYGLKQIVVKMLFLRKQQTENHFFQKLCLECHKNNFYKSKKRLVIFLFVLHCCISIVRIVTKYSLSKYFNEDYLNIVRPNEWLIYLIFSGCSPPWVVIFDGLYALGFPIAFICIGAKLYEAYLSRDSFCPNCLTTNRDRDISNDINGDEKVPNEINGDEKIINEINGDEKIPNDINRDEEITNEVNGDEVILNEIKDLGDAFVFPWYLLCANCNGTSKSNCSCKKASMTVLSFLICLCPIIPFTCNSYSACQFIHLRYHRMNTLSKIVCICLSFLFSYLLCLRPIISSFTFVFRSLTSFVFVALPIRPHIFRYTLIIVTIVVYILKYISEIINMNAEILSYIFEIEESERAEQTEVLIENTQKEPQHKFKVDYIKEEMFDFIYKRLFFVKKRLYFVFFKMLIVFMFLLIVFETFLDNKTLITGTNYKDIMELIIIFIGPYAISLFLKANEDYFLSNKNKDEIKKLYKSYNETTSDSNYLII